MRVKRVAMCASPAIVPVGPCVSRFLYLVPAFRLVWNSRAHRGSARVAGIRDAPIKVHLVRYGDPEARRHSLTSSTPVSPLARIRVPPSIVSHPSRNILCKAFGKCVVQAPNVVT
jgi:hypothetical protein